MKLPFYRLRKFISEIIFPEQREKRNLLRRAAETDSLTGFGNFQSFERAKNSKNDFDVFVFFDLNNFGLINKWKSFEEGNKEIVRFSKCLKESCEIFEISRIWRLGGDEFCVICNQNDSYSLLSNVLLRFGDKEIADENGSSAIVSASGGIGYEFNEAEGNCKLQKFTIKRNQHFLFSNPS